MDKSAKVEQWNPPFSGDIDIVIAANGDWFHEGIKFTRQPLIDLFASILRKEGTDYYLVTPVEKWRIRVEDAPLYVTDYEVRLTENNTQTIILKTSTGDFFALDAQHPLHIKNTHGDEIRPYVLARNNLQALLSRNVFYALAEIAEEQNGHFGVRSGGEFLALE